MADPNDADETPMQRALRLKKAAQQGKAKSPVTGRSAERSAAAKSSAKSKPWMSR
ncbi:MAG: hypothetical protein JSR86_14155 [Proteobacteria bacterium]|nr:hypothetical protein [Pseudomonadota bacterium]